MNATPSESTDLIPRLTLPVMAETFRASVAAMKESLTRLAEARDRLHEAFGSGDRHSCAFDFTEVWRRNYGDVPDTEAVALLWKQAAWRILVDRMELKRICSVKRAKEIDAQLEDPKQLPDITEANILAMLEGNARSLTDFLNEAVVECFEKLRPWQRGELGDRFVTNKVFQVGERVILTYSISHGYGRGKFRLSYQSDKTQLVRCLDNVMHMLDGKGAVPTHAGPLVDALNGEGNQGFVETDYFEARSFRNGNLHLRFKRADLLAELNRRGSGMAPNLPGQEKQRRKAAP